MNEIHRRENLLSSVRGGADNNFTGSYADVSFNFENASREVPTHNTNVVLSNGNVLMPRQDKYVTDFKILSREKMPDLLIYPLVLDVAAQRKLKSKSIKMFKERVRRGKMNESLKELRKLVPGCEDEKKVKQSLLIENSVLYIKSIEKNIKALKAENTLLVEQNKNFKREIFALICKFNDMEKKIMGSNTLDMYPNLLFLKEMTEKIGDTLEKNDVEPVLYSSRKDSFGHLIDGKSSVYQESDGKVYPSLLVTTHDEIKLGQRPSISKSKTCNNSENPHYNSSQSYRVNTNNQIYGQQLSDNKNNHYSSLTPPNQKQITQNNFEEYHPINSFHPHSKHSEEDEFYKKSKPSPTTVTTDFNSCTNNFNLNSAIEFDELLNCDIEDVGPWPLYQYNTNFENTLYK